MHESPSQHQKQIQLMQQQQSLLVHHQSSPIPIIYAPHASVSSSHHVAHLIQPTSTPFSTLEPIPAESEEALDSMPADPSATAAFAYSVPLVYGIDDFDNSGVESREGGTDEVDEETKRRQQSIERQYDMRPYQHRLDKPAKSDQQLANKSSSVDNEKERAPLQDWLGPSSLV